MPTESTVARRSIAPKPRRLQILSCIVALSVLACDSKPPSGPIPVHPTSGKVVSGGKPVAGALVIFHRDGVAPPITAPGSGGEASIQAPVPTGKTDAEGRFQVHTYVGIDGAPTGSYKVTVVLAGPSEGRDVMAKTSVAASNVALPAKYANPAQSGLTATIKAGENVLPPFEL